MALGFWRLAAEDPDRVALVTPDGTGVTAGDLAAQSNRVAHALRDHGVAVGETVACVLPNSREVVALYLAAMQIGAYFTPINHHLVGPEIAYIVNTTEGRQAIADSFSIRREALQQRVTYSTTVAGARALLHSLDYRGSGPVWALHELHEELEQP